MATKDPTKDHEDQSPETEAMRARRHGKIECFSRTEKKGLRYYWHARSSNGKIVADSGEGYNSAQARDDGLDAARTVLTTGQRVDL